MTNPKHENPKFNVDDRLALMRLRDVTAAFYPKEKSAFLKKLKKAHSPCQIAKVCREHSKEAKTLINGLMNELKIGLPDEKLLKKIDKCKGDFRKVEGLGSQ